MNALQARITDPTKPLPETPIEWTPGSQSQARSKGWEIIDDSGPGEPPYWIIQRNNYSDRFRTDNEVCVHILRRVHDREFGELERKALAFIRANSPEFYQEVLLDLASRFKL